MKKYENHEKTREIAKKLLSSKNVIIAERKTLSTLISQESDIVISMAFVSTGVEAMCLGIKSFYVDLINTYQNSYFDNFDKLVSHSETSALDNVEHWLKIKKTDVLNKYVDIFNDMGITKANIASELIRNKIVKKLTEKI